MSKVPEDGPAGKVFLDTVLDTTETVELVLVGGISTDARDGDTARHILLLHSIDNAVSPVNPLRFDLGNKDNSLNISKSDRDGVWVFIRDLDNLAGVALVEVATLLLVAGETNQLRNDGWSRFRWFIMVMVSVSFTRPLEDVVLVLVFEVVGQSECKRQAFEGVAVCDGKGGFLGDRRIAACEGGGHFA